ncbi:MAG: sigma-70 family RNA polymerase sigma factor [Clostridia bacterium]|nr:sigma-70 family RNA polymerase sigma factor [Clostridia bacterium]
MYNKVEICGVNTASLKVLEEGEKIRLIEEWQAGRRSARDELVSGNLRLVLSLVQRFAGRGENLDDLFQVGCIGLIKAVDHFDITVGVRFSTYAVPLIIGEIRRYLRDNSSMRISRSLRDTAYRAMQIKEKLQSDYAREPTIEEIAQVLEEPKEDVVIALEAVTPPVSLYETVYAEGSRLAWWRCPVGHSWRSRIRERTKERLGCTECRAVFSAKLPILLLASALDKAEVKTIPDHVMKTGLRLELFVPALMLAAEAEGVSAERRREQADKKKECADQGIRYIIVKAGKDWKETASQTEKLLKENGISISCTGEMIKELWNEYRAAVNGMRKEGKHE